MRDHSAHVTLTREQAIDALLTHMQAASATELVGILGAWGRVCAADCRAATDVPNATCAQMDGIAVRFADFSDGIPDTSLWRPGRDFGWANTGTAIPAGFDSVIPIEEVRFPKAPTLDEKNPGAPLFDAAPRTAGAFCRQRGCDFAFGDVAHAGELACILGANGSGKTTTLRAILGLVSPTQGDVLVEGASTLGLSDLARARIFAYVPQASEPPFPYLVQDVVMLGRTPHLRGSQVPGTRDEEAARKAMARMGILGIAERPFTQLSGGQRQLVLIARALAQEPRVLVMDEPTASLDFGNQLHVLTQARELARDGMAVLMVTHDPDHALAFADRVILVENGLVTAEGAPDSVLTDAVLSQVYRTPVHVARVAGGVGWCEQRVCVPGLRPQGR